MAIIHRKKIRKDEQKELEELYKRMLWKENQKHIAEETHYVRQKKALFTKLSNTSSKEPSRLRKWYSTSILSEWIQKLFGKVSYLIYRFEYGFRKSGNFWNDFKPKLKENRLFIGASLLVCISLFTSGYFYKNMFGYEVIFNGNNIGVVKDVDTFETAMNEVDRQLCEWYENSNLFYEQSISYKKVKISDDTKLLDVAGCEKGILSTDINLFCNGAVIVVDGKETVKLASKEQAKTVIDTVLADYNNVGSEEKVIAEAEIEEDIKFVEKIVALSSVKNIDEAVTFLTKGGSTAGDDGGDVSNVFNSADEETNMVSALNFRREEFSVNEVTSVKPVITIKIVKEVMYEEKIAYGTTYKDDSSLYVGDEQVTKEGVPGVKKVNAVQTFENGEVVSTEVLSEKVLKEPVNEVVSRGTKPLPPVSSTGRFVIPTTGNVSAINKAGSHAGSKAVDISNAQGTAIYASDSGVVTKASWYGGYGNCIIISHGNGYSTLYGHLKSYKVSVGDRVTQGQIIARMGSTGNSTGSHLHFEVQYNGSRMKITNYFSFLRVGKGVQALQ